MQVETKAQEKERMLSQYVYYQKDNGEIDCVVNTKKIIFHYGAAAAFILSYMRQTHKCSLPPQRD